MISFILLLRWGLQSLSDALQRYGRRLDGHRQAD